MHWAVILHQFATPYSPVDCAPEVFKPLKDSASLLVCNEKNFFYFGSQIFCGWHHKWGRFLASLAQVTWPWAQPLDRSILLKFLLETRLKSRVFWAFDQLSSISGSRAPNFIKSPIFVKLLISGKIINFVFLAITFEPEMLETWSNVQKTWILAWFPIKTWVKYLHLAVKSYFIPPFKSKVTIYFYSHVTTHSW